MTIVNKQRKQTEESGGNNNWCCYASREVGHLAGMCPNMEKALATWKEKKADENKLTEKTEQQMVERHLGSCSYCKKGGYGAKGRENEQYFHLAQTSKAENDNANVFKIQVISDCVSNDDDHFDDLGSGNGDGSK